MSIAQEDYSMQNRIKIYASALFLLYFLSSVTAQIPGMPEMALKERKNVFGGTSTDVARSVIRTADGGSMVAGYTFSDNGDVSGNHGGYDMWIVKFSRTNIIEWQKTFGGAGNDGANSIIQTSDGSYVAAGFLDAGNGFSDMWVIKFSATGTIEWEQVWGGTKEDMANSIIQTTDGGYAFTGYTYSTDGDVSGNHGDSDISIVKLDASGNVQWQKILGGTANEFANSIIQTTDDGYAVAGLTSSNNGNVSGNHGGFDMWVVRLDSAGDMQWQKTLGGTGSDAASSIIRTADGGYAVAGYAFSNSGNISGNNGDYDMWAVKLNGAGDILWQKPLGGTKEESANCIIQAADGGYIVAGRTQSDELSGYHGSRDALVTKIDASGTTVEWQKVLGGTGNEVAYSVFRTTDGKFVVAGTSSSADGDISGPPYGSDDFFILWLDASGRMIPLYEDASQ